MVSHDVLVVPRQHAAPGVPVQGQPAHELPPPLRAADGSVARVVHGVQQGHHLEDAVDGCGEALDEEGQLRQQVADADGEAGEADWDLDGRAPQAREGVLGVQLRRLKVLAHASGHYTIEVRGVRGEQRKFGWADHRTCAVKRTRKRASSQRCDRPGRPGSGDGRLRAR